jgi:hypothetical protein
MADARLAMIRKKAMAMTIFKGSRSCYRNTIVGAVQ